MTLKKHKNLLKKVLKITRLGVLTKVFFCATMLTKVLFYAMNELPKVLVVVLRVTGKHIIA